MNQPGAMTGGATTGDQYHNVIPNTPTSPLQSIPNAPTRPGMPMDRMGRINQYRQAMLRNRGMGWAPPMAKMIPGNGVPADLAYNDRSPSEGNLTATPGTQPQQPSQPANPYNVPPMFANQGFVPGGGAWPSTPPIVSNPNKPMPGTANRPAAPAPAAQPPRQPGSNRQHA